MVQETVHVATTIERSAGGVYEYVSDPHHLSEWASGLAHRPVERVDGQWVVDSPLGRVVVEFAAANDYGIADHVVTLPDGTGVQNPMRDTECRWVRCRVQCSPPAGHERLRVRRGRRCRPQRPRRTAVNPPALTHRADPTVEGPSRGAALRAWHPRWAVPFCSRVMCCLCCSRRVRIRSRSRRCRRRSGAGRCR